LQGTFKEGSELSVSSKTKNLLGLLSGILPAELKKEITKNYQKVSDDEGKKFNIDTCITPEIRQYLVTKMEEIEKQSSNLSASADSFDKWV